MKTFPFLGILTLSFFVVFLGFHTKSVNSQAVNLLDNGSFEKESTVGWSSTCHGMTFQAVKGNNTIPVRSGNYSAIVSNRNFNYCGPQLDLYSILQSNIDKVIALNISMYIYLPSKENEYETCELILYKNSVQNNDEYRALDTLYVSRKDRNRWIYMNGFYNFELDLGKIDVRNLRTYIQCTNSSTWYYVDDAQVSLARDWREISKQGIESHRKGMLSVKLQDKNGNIVTQGDILNRYKISINQTRKGFYFGSAIGIQPPQNSNSRVISDSDFTNKYQPLFLKWFNTLTMEWQLKWMENQPTQNAANFLYADQIVAWAIKNKLSMRGHTVFWEDPTHVPDWFKILPLSEKRVQMTNRTEQVLTRYQDKFVNIDLHNENVHFTYFRDNMGEDVLAWSFNVSKSIDSKTPLFINDYDILEGNDCSKLIELVKRIDELAGREVVNGIGMQSHFEKQAVDPYYVKRQIHKLVEAFPNKQLWVTEYDSKDSNVGQVAQNLEFFYRTTFAERQIKGIVMWGFWEGNQWLGSEACLVNLDWTVNEAGKRYEALVLDEWTTKMESLSIPSNNGIMSVSVFHGDYQIILEKNGIPIQTFNLSVGENDTIVNVTLQIDEISTLTCNGTLVSSSSVCNGKGLCVSFDICFCNDPNSYGGAYCEIPKCNNILANDTSLVCNGRGSCTTPNVCKCYNPSTWGGNYCEINRNTQVSAATQSTFRIAISIATLVFLLFQFSLVKVN